MWIRNGGSREVPTNTYLAYYDRPIQYSSSYVLICTKGTIRLTAKVINIQYTTTIFNKLCINHSSLQKSHSFNSNCMQNQLTSITCCKRAQLFCFDEYTNVKFITKYHFMFVGSKWREISDVLLAPWTIILRSEFCELLLETNYWCRRFIIIATDDNPS